MNRDRLVKRLRAIEESADAVMHAVAELREQIDDDVLVCLDITLKIQYVDMFVRDGHIEVWEYVVPVKNDSTTSRRRIRARVRVRPEHVEYVKNYSTHAKVVDGDDSE